MDPTLSCVPGTSVWTLMKVCDAILLLLVLSSEWTLQQSSSPPGARLCVTWVQVEGWFRVCSPICWQAGVAPVQEDPVSPQTLPHPTHPLRKSWRKITTATLYTPDSISTSMDTPETPTVSIYPPPKSISIIHHKITTAVPRGALYCKVSSL